MNSIEKANDFSNYTLLTLAIIIGTIGVFLRFAGDSATLSTISWIIFVIGWVIGIRAVFKILQ